MVANTKIEWAHHTFNPWIGCTKVSPACDNCYAEAFAKRTGGPAWGHGQPRRRTSPAYWRKPLAWNRQAETEGRRYRVFCASLADVFDTEVPDDWRDALFCQIRATPNLDWLLLTKRPQAARAYLRTFRDVLPNVWLGTTVENQAMAEARVPILLDTPAAVRFLSMEPLLGPVDLVGHIARGKAQKKRRFADHQLLGSLARTLGDDLPCGIDWVIVGGESGPQARPMHPDWARSLRDQCTAASIAFFFKQWGEHAGSDHAVSDLGRLVHVWPDGRWCAYRDLGTGTYKRTSGDGHVTMARVGKKAAGRLLDGRTWDEFPEVGHA